MYVVVVRIHVIADRVSDFIAATLANAHATRKEPGNVRFDVLSHHED
nr:antibiotic biosynthesis monooxygenase [Deltaproteobacteria bacterium]